MVITQRASKVGGLALAVRGLAFLVAVRAAAVEPQVLPGHLAAGTAGLKAVGRLDGSTPMHLALALPLRDPTGLKRFLADICDPASANFRHYLTVEQFRERFGPTEQDCRAVAAFAQARGLSVNSVHRNRMLVEVSGAAATVEQALGLNLRVYRHPTEHRNFYAPHSEPRVDQGLRLLHIGGLDNFVLPRPAGLRRLPGASGGAPVPASGSGGFGSYAGGDFRAAYAPGVALTGAGQTLALLEFAGYYPSDITRYEDDFQLPAVTVTNVLLSGVTNVTQGANTANGMEPALDIEMAVSMAPGLSAIAVYIGLFSDTILSRIASDNSARQISVSWTFPTDAASTQFFQEFAAQGQSYFNASGDTDAYTGAVPSPTDNPYITIVGGTTLTTTGPGGSWFGETTWNRGNGAGSSGGVSPIYPIPPWQEGVNMTANLGSMAMRNLPDVAMVAENVWLISEEGQTAPVGGTSVSSPLWAAFTALVNEQATNSGRPPVGFINPSVYLVGKGAGYASAFHDIITGNNFGSNTAPRFPAVAGYDLCTGWGTPAGSNLINALVAPVDILRISPDSGFTAVTPYGTPFSATNISFTLSNASTTTLSWTLGNTSVWLKASSSAGVLSASVPTTVVTISLNPPATSNLLTGTYYANLWFTNQSTAFIQSRLFAVEVSSANWPLSLAGLNAGVIAPTTATLASPQATAFDPLNDYCLYQAGLTGGSQGLPASGSFVSQADNTTVFQLGPAGGTNVLLTGAAYPGWATLRFPTPQPYNSLAILAASVNGDSEAVLGVNFADGTPSQWFGVVVPDWFGSTNNAAIQGFGFLKLGGFAFGDLGSASPSLAQIAIDLAGMGLNHPVASVTFSNLTLNATQDCGVFAVSGAVMPAQPLFIQEPESVTNVVPAEPAVFNVVATGQPPLAYQWFFSSNAPSGPFAPLTGQTNTELALAVPSPTNSGGYYVVVTNAFGGVTSPAATLTLFRAPVIVQQPRPASATLLAGQNFALSVTAHAALPVSYSWMQGSLPLAPGTNSALLFAPLDPTNTGNYSVIISNGFGEATSGVVSLTVIAAPDYPYGQVVLADQPSGYWRLDERSGTVVHDYVAGNNGSYSHATLGQAGDNVLDSHTAARFGTPLSANSYAGNIPVGFATAFNAAFSVEAWANGNAQNLYSGLVSKGTGGNEQFCLDCGAAGNAFRFMVRDSTGNSYIANGTIAPDGQWHYLAGVCDQANGSIFLYVDGSEAAQAAIDPSSGILGSTNPITIGSRQSGTSTFDLQFIGYMEEVAVYDYALSPAQIRAHFGSVTNRPPEFLADPLVVASATAGQAYAGSLATYAVDPDGYTITFSLVSGPAWLSVAGNGALGGTPSASDVGTNLFVVNATDLSALNAKATMLLDVQPAPFTAAAALQGTKLLLTWTASTGTYVVQTTTNLLSPNWQTLAGPLTGTSLLITPSNSPAFYRITAQ